MFEPSFSCPTLAVVTCESNPIRRWPMRFSMMRSRPSKAPPQMNRMSVVLIWRNSWWGCLRPPWWGSLGDGALQGS